MLERTVQAVAVAVANVCTLVLSGAALAQDPAPTGAAATPAAATDPAPAGPVTFSEHVAPIVFHKCASCHRPGEVAPFPLQSYQDVRKRGRMIVKVTERRYMPPWHPVEGHGEFEGEMRLSDAEVDTLQAWVRGGMPEGDPQMLPPMPDYPEGWQLGEPDLVVQMPKAYDVPAAGPDIYRNFVVPMELDEDKWLTAVEVRPSARSVLHHVIFGVDTSGRARELDGQDGQPGFFGMGGGSRSGTGTAAVGGWAVGGMPRHLPMGLARRVPKNSDLVLRSHFHPSGKAESEQTTLGLYFSAKPPLRSMVGLQMPPGFGIAAGIDVPPGESDFEITDSFTLPVDALAVTVGGHAHYICKEMQIFATPPDGERRSVFWIDDWDFNWQNRYQYKEPLRLSKGTKIDVRIRYDNSADNPDNPFDPPQRIRWGLESTDEMGSVTLLLVAARERDTRALQRAVRSHAREKLSRRRSARGFGAAILTRIKMLDRNGDGKIEQSEIPERYRRSLERADTDGDGVIDARELEALERRYGGGRRERDGDGDRDR